MSVIPERALCRVLSCTRQEGMPRHSNVVFCCCNSHGLCVRTSAGRAGLPLGPVESSSDSFRKKVCPSCPLPWQFVVPQPQAVLSVTRPFSKGSLCSPGQHAPPPLLHPCPSVCIPPLPLIARACAQAKPGGRAQAPCDPAQRYEPCPKAPSRAPATTQDQGERLRGCMALHNRLGAFMATRPICSQAPTPYQQ